MSYIDPKIIEEIRQKADIMDVVGNYLPLTKKGSSYLALCPFHDDSNPSMHVNREKQIYKCFVCNAGGNVYNFVQRYEGVSFVEAVQIIADQVGYPLEIAPVFEKTIDPHLQSLQQVMQEASRFAQYQLKNESSEPLAAFLEARQLDAKIISYFELGYNGHTQAMTQFLQGKNYHDELLVSSDLSRLVENRLRDTFYDRVLFPIQDSSGQVVGFSGRSIMGSDVKYINTGNTPLYQKGHILYNYHRVLDPLLKNDVVILCEGVMDVIAFYKAGFRKVIASLGTALTDQQVTLLSQLRSDIVLAYDGDEAGIKANYQIGQRLRQANLQVSVLHNKTELDPDDLLNTLGKEALVQMVQTPMHWLEFVLDYGKKLYNLGAYEGRKDFAQFFLKHLRQVDRLDQVNFIRQLATLTDFEYSDLEGLLNQMGQPEKPSRRSLVSTKKPLPILNIEKEILVYILKSKQFAIYFRDNLGYLIHPQMTNLALLLIDQYNHVDEIDLAAMLSTSLSELQQEVLITLLENEQFNVDLTLGGLQEAIKQIEIIDLKGLLQQLEQRAQGELLVEKKAQYIQQMVEIQHKIQLLTEDFNE